MIESTIYPQSLPTIRSSWLRIIGGRVTLSRDGYELKDSLQFSSSPLPIICSFGGISQSSLNHNYEDPLAPIQISRCVSGTHPQLIRCKTVICGSITQSNIYY